MASSSVCGRSRADAARTAPSRARQRAYELHARFVLSRCVYGSLRRRTCASARSDVSPQMTRILVLDEEPRFREDLLQLHGYQEWEIVLACNLRAALDLIERIPFDIVASDVQLTDADGVEFLRRVKELQPCAVRIVLSHPLESAQAARTLSVAHQCVSKPCDSLVLKSVLRRAIELRRIFNQKAIMEIAGGIDKLPSVSDTYWELTRALASRQTSSEDIAQIIQKDTAMSAKLLQIVNSGFFGLARRVTSVAEAIAYVGTDLLRGLMLQEQLFASVQMMSIDGFSLEKFQQHALLVAKLAKKLVGSSQQGEEAFTAALLHDIGKLLIAFCCQDGFEHVIEEQRRSNRPVDIIEKELLGVTHAEVGGYLLGLWGLPLSIVESVAFHHSPMLCVNAECELLAAVHVADALSKMDQAEEDGPITGGEWDDAFLGRLELAGVRARGLALRNVSLREGKA